MALLHRQTVVRHYAECLDQAVAAEDLGMDMVWLGEHHVTPDGFLPSPLVAAGAVAARTARIGIGILILPLHDPVRVAEEVAVADQVPHDHLCYWARPPGVSHVRAVHSMQLFAEQVIPGVRRLSVRRLSAGDGPAPVPGVATPVSPPGDGRWCRVHER